MAKNTPKLQPLTVTEIILRGEADVIRAALEAREKIDTLLAEREAAYQRIAELEAQVDEIVGDDADFPFPAPPVPVAAFDFRKAPAKKSAAKPKPTPTPPPQPAALAKNEAAPASESKEDSAES